MIEDGAPQVGHDPLSYPRHKIEAAIGGYRQDADDAQHHQQALVQERWIAGGEALIDQGAQTGAEPKDGAGRYRQGEARTCDGRPVGLQERHKAAKRAQIPARGRCHGIRVGRKLLGRLDLGRCTKHPEGSLC